MLSLVQDHCEGYLKAEVLPYRPLEEIEEDINGLEKEILAMLKEVTT